MFSRVTGQHHARQEVKLLVQVAAVLATLALIGIGQAGHMWPHRAFNRLLLLSKLLVVLWSHKNYGRTRMLWSAHSLTALGSAQACSLFTHDALLGDMCEVCCFNF